MARAVDLDEVTSALRASGARFAYLFGSRAGSEPGPDADTDVAAWWGVDPPDPWAVSLPDGVDLLVLDTAPLELAGRVARDGRLLYEDQAAARVAWEAETRKIWFDEKPRTDESRRIALAAMRDRG